MTEPKKAARNEMYEATSTPTSSMMPTASVKGRARRTGRYQSGEGQGQGTMMMMVHNGP